MNTRELIEEAVSLPVEQRALVVDSLLRSLSLTNPEVDEQWYAVTKRRLEELRSRKVDAIPANQVFDRLEKGAGPKVPPNPARPRFHA